MSISGLRGDSGSSCRVLSDLFARQFRASGDILAPAVGYCLILLSVNFGPPGILLLQLSKSFHLSIPGLRGHSGSSCWVLSPLFVCQFRASGDTLTPADGHFLSVCLSISGLKGHSGSSCRYCQILVSVNFRPQGILLLQLSSIFWSICQFRASGDTLAPASGYFLILLFVNVGPQGTL